MLWALLLEHKAGGIHWPRSDKPYCSYLISVKSRVQCCMRVLESLLWGLEAKDTDLSSEEAVYSKGWAFFCWVWFQKRSLVTFPCFGCTRPWQEHMHWSRDNRRITRRLCAFLSSELLYGTLLLYLDSKWHRYRRVGVSRKRKMCCALSLIPALFHKELGIFVCTFEMCRLRILPLAYLLYCNSPL